MLCIFADPLPSAAKRKIFSTTAISGSWTTRASRVALKRYPYLAIGATVRPSLAFLSLPLLPRSAILARSLEQLAGMREWLDKLERKVG